MKLNRMRTNTTSAILALSFGLLSISTSAQIVIDEVDFPTEQTTFRSTYYWALNESSYGTPSEGAEQFWDFRNLTENGNADFPYYTTTDPFFDETFHFEASALALSSFFIRADFHSGLDDIGYFSYGMEQYDTTFSLTATTGGAMDELHFPDFKQYFDGVQNSMFFPLTYQDWWIDTVTRVTPFDITIAAFGLNATPGNHKRVFTYDNEVVGYGGLLMTDSSGADSDTMQVLLVKSWIQFVDSFFVGGQPAPAALLTGLGLTQGAVTNELEYYFYREGYGDILVEVEAASDVAGTTLLALRYNENGVKEQTVVDTTVASIAELDESEVSVFPNPVRAGASLKVGVSAEKADVASLQIAAADGREVYASAITAVNGPIEFALPNDLPAGVYVIQALNEDGTAMFSKRLVVVE